MRKPKITIKELRHKEPKTAIVMDSIIRGIFHSIWQGGAFRGSGYGYEEALEITETLIDKGFLKILYDEDEESFSIGAWDEKQQDYI